ncbi:unnamed protein product [Euphydryas editha]|uniref:Uncharacterized protein n=1 Tax=Euphydryas editha TaxID=104508 RepID=A0AAU9U4C2_EUPED|nr:unnamed protein product [Euphydryas editha]
MLCSKFNSCNGHKTSLLRWTELNQPVNNPLLGKGLFSIAHYHSGLAENFPTRSDDRYQVSMITTGTDGFMYSSRHGGETHKDKHQTRNKYLDK